MTFEDRFNRADDTTLGPSWTALVGTWGIEGGKARLYTNSAQAAAVAETGQADGDLRCALTTSPTIQRIDCGVVFRAADNNNYMLVTLTRTAAENTVALWKRVGGSFTLLWSGFSAGMSVDWNRTYAVKVTYEGQDVTVYLDNAPQFRWAGITGLESNTKAGIRVHYGATSDDLGTRFDNFSVQEINPAIRPDVVDFENTWRVLRYQAINASDGDPLGYAPVAFDDSAWPSLQASYYGLDTGWTPPVTSSLAHFGQVTFNTDIGYNNEAYYRIHFTVTDATDVIWVQIDGWVDNRVWYYLNGTYVGEILAEGGDYGRVLPSTSLLVEGDNLLFARSKSQGGSGGDQNTLATRLWIVYPDVVPVGPARPHVRIRHADQSPVRIRKVPYPSWSPRIRTTLCAAV